MNHARLSSWLLLGGIAAGFLLASWQGHRSAATSKPDDFQRFHQRLGPEALFYPPYEMLEALALERWAPGRTLVIVGGNSILNGVGQIEGTVWSLRLQELLGDKYVVVNLALRSAAPAQAGALVAESLQRRGYPVIYVANTTPVAGPGRAAGAPLGYLYWQAQALGRLDAFPARDAATAAWAASLPPAGREHLAEERLGGRLDAWFHPQSLWHDLGYRHVFTVWNSLLRRKFWVARQDVSDNEPVPRAVEDRYQNNFAIEMDLVRGHTAMVAEATPDGGWRLTDTARRQLGAEIDTTFPPALRPRTLMLLVESSPYYLARLTPAERDRDRAIHAAAAAAWREHGIASVVAGGDFTPDDFADRAHLTRDGGDKLADLVAAEIHRLDATAP